MINFPKEELVGLELNDLLDEKNSFILQNLLNNYDHAVLGKAELTWKANKNQMYIQSFLHLSFLMKTTISLVSFCCLEYHAKKRNGIRAC